MECNHVTLNELVKKIPLNKLNTLVNQTLTTRWNVHLLANDPHEPVNGPPPANLDRMHLTTVHIKKDGAISILSVE